MGRSGSYTYVQYANEATWQTAPTYTRVFGMEQKATNVSVNQNQINVTDINSNVVQAFAYGQFEGTFDVDFILSNPWFLDLMFGAPTVTGTGPYTYTYPTSIPKSVTSFATEIGSTLETENVQRTLLGCIVGSFRASARLNEVVRCTLSNKYGKETDPGTTIDSSPATDSYSFPFTFEHAKLELPSGTTLAEVQSFELSINPNQNFIWGMNGIYPTSAWRGLMEMTGRFNLTAKDSTWIVNALARSEQATLKMTFTNGASGTAERSINLAFTGVGLNTHSASYNPNELTLEDLPLVMRNKGTITAVNNTSSAP